MTVDTSVAAISPDSTDATPASRAALCADMWPQVRAGLEFLQKPFPDAAVALAEAHRDEVAPHLVATLEALAADPALARDENYTLHLFAMHLLAGWRDQRAFAPLLALGQVHDEQLLDDVFGDLLHDSYGRCLASVSGGDIAPMMALVDDPLTSVWVRGAVVDALTDCILEGEADRGDIVSWLGVVAEREAAALRAGRKPGDIPFELINVIVVSLSDLGAIDWLPAIRQWHSEGLLDPTFADWGAIEQNIAAPVDHALARLRSERRGYVADAASEMSWWAMFHLPSSVAATDDRKYTWSSSLAARRPAKYDHAPSAREPVRPVVREQPKVGRNDPCPCGSARKFKKCHGAA
jgi:hypothetical protein